MTCETCETCLCDACVACDVRFRSGIEMLYPAFSAFSALVSLISFTHCQTEDNNHFATDWA